MVHYDGAGSNQQQQPSQYAVDPNGNGYYGGGLRGGNSESITLRLRGGLESDSDDDEQDVKPVIASSSTAALPSTTTASGTAPIRDSRGALVPSSTSSTAPVPLKPNENGIFPGEEVIDSDLDDSSSSASSHANNPYAGSNDGFSDEEDDLAKDVMVCVCDKVQRVKNKWKVTFKDGFIRAQGKEYVFSRCTG